MGWLTDDKSGAFYFAQKDPIYLKVLFRQKSHPILEHSVSSFTFHEMGFAISLSMEFQNLKTERDKTLKIKNQVSFCKDKAELAEMPLCLFEILHLYDTAY